MCRRWLAAIETQSEVKLEQPDAIRRLDRDGRQNCAKKKKEEGQPKNRH
jgi:hypothetical protein